MSRMFIPKTQKMVLDATFLNTQHYKLKIKGKVEQSSVAIEKGAFGSSTLLLYLLKLCLMLTNEMFVRVLLLNWLVVSLIDVAV